MAGRGELLPIARNHDCFFALDEVDFAGFAERRAKSSCFAVDAPVLAYVSAIAKNHLLEAWKKFYLSHAKRHLEAVLVIDLSVDGVHCAVALHFACLRIEA